MRKIALNIINLSVIAGIVIIAANAFGLKLFQGWTPDSGEAPPATKHLSVVSVSDGDSITVRQTNGENLKIRLCGIDAPEKAQPMGKQAKEYLLSLIAKGDGSVMVTPLETDRYGRTVAEVFVKPKPGTGYQAGEEIFVNGDMAIAGFAYHYAKYSGNCPNRTVIVSSEEIAKGKRAGVWSDPNAVLPWELRKQQRR